MLSSSAPASKQAGQARPPDRAQARLPRLGRALAAVAALAAFLFLAGFAAFLLSIERRERPPSAQADGIVVLTGGAQRIEDALDLLARGFARRLLITGVNERTSRAGIARLTPGQRDLLECCVDLDYKARNTVGNAAEIGRWVRQRGFRSLIVVTSNYHLPRALAELEEALPDVAKTGFPVVATKPGEEWRPDPARWRLLVSEYVKFVAASVRRRLAGTRPAAHNLGGA